MKKVLWAVQGNMLSDENEGHLFRALSRLDIDHIRVTAIPFSNDIPEDVPTDRPVVFYGAVKFMQRVHESGLWTPGVFFSDADYRMSRLEQGFGKELMFNKDMRLTTLRDLAAEDHKQSDTFFLRPDRDSKDFSGKVMAFYQIQQWAENLSSLEEKMKSDGDLIPESFNQDTEIIVAAEREISAEFRLFVVNGSVVAGSRYRRYAALDQSMIIPQCALDFAKHAMSIYKPDTGVFVLDVAYDEEEGSYGVMEINCFNSSGFYHADTLAIVHEVSAYSEEHYNLLLNKEVQ